MRVRVRLLGSLRPANMRVGIEVELPSGSSLTTLIEEIVKQHHEVAGSLRSPAGNLMMIDGVEAGNLGGLDTQLSDGSEVVLVPVTHGG
jgi:molybdopterin converting factor small subunit